MFCIVKLPFVLYLWFYGLMCVYKYCVLVVLVQLYVLKVLKLGPYLVIISFSSIAHIRFRLPHGKPLFTCACSEEHVIPNCHNLY